LDFDGNYQVAISDPYALAQHALGVEVTGLLKSDEFYSKYWNNLSTNKVAAFRSPLTWEAETNVFSLVDNEDCRYWYKYINSGIVLNIQKDVTMKLGGSD